MSAIHIFRSGTHTDMLGRSVTVSDADLCAMAQTSDPVVGDPDGVSNRPARELANRTAWLKERQAATDTALAEHVKSHNHPDGTLTEKGFLLPFHRFHWTTQDLHTDVLTDGPLTLFHLLQLAISYFHIASMRAPFY